MANDFSSMANLRSDCDSSWPPACNLFKREICSRNVSGSRYVKATSWIAVRCFLFFSSSFFRCCLRYASAGFNPPFFLPIFYDAKAPQLSDSLLKLQSFRHQKSGSIVNCRKQL